MIICDKMRAKFRLRETEKNKKMMEKNETNITFMAKFKFNLVPRRFVNTFGNFAQNVQNTHIKDKEPSILANTYTARTCTVHEIYLRLFCQCCVRVDGNVWHILNEFSRICAQAFSLDFSSSFYTFSLRNTKYWRAQRVCAYKCGLEFY